MPVSLASRQKVSVLASINRPTSISTSGSALVAHVAKVCQEVLGMNRGHLRRSTDEVLVLLADQFRRPSGDRGWSAGLQLSSATVITGVVAAAVEGRSSACGLCALRTSDIPLEGLSGGASVAYRDDDVMALVVPGHPGALVVPSRHVKSLSALPATSGVILAALRRAVRAVESSYQVAGVTIEPTTDVGHADGHVAYWVIPTLPATISTPDTDEQAEAVRCDLAAYLRPLTRSGQRDP